MRIAMVLVLAAPLLACGGAPPEAAQPAAPTEQSPAAPVGEVEPPPEPVVRVIKVDENGNRSVEIDGPYVAAGMTFPLEVAGFKRITIHEYASRDLGRAIGYRGLDDNTNITVYVFGDGVDLKNHYLSARAAITQRSVGTLLSEADLELSVDGKNYKGKHAHYELQESAGLTQSTLTVFSIRGFFLKYRVTTTPDSPLDVAALRKLQEALGVPSSDEL